VRRSFQIARTTKAALPDGPRQHLPHALRTITARSVDPQPARSRAGRCGNLRLVSDRRYSTAQWQRVRKAVLARYGHLCQIQGPRCTGYATTVHHVVPSSQAPELFWAEENLVAACSRCNYADGAAIAADNRRSERARLLELEQENQRLERAVEELERRCEELALALTRHRPRAKRSRTGGSRRSARPIASSRLLRGERGGSRGEIF
jgi:5-methylcytosine-specific restriction protein A